MNLSNQLHQLLHDLSHLRAEVTLISGALLVLIIGLFKVPTYFIKGVVAAVLTLTFLNLETGGNDLFFGMISSSLVSISMTKIMLISSIFLLVFVGEIHQRSSYYFVLLITLLGAILMTQSFHFLLIYLSVEMVSFGGYILTNFSFRKQAHEAGMKYLLFGGVCSAIMLFGISMIYGATGELFLSSTLSEGWYAKAGASMFLVGVLFKISAVPFHIWVPNVYQIAPIEITTFLSIVPKIAGLVLLGNVLSGLQWGSDWVIAIGILSLISGTFGAVRQTNFRRLISYGTIAHTGFLIPFVVWVFPTNVFVWYVAIYALMNIGVFYVISYYEKQRIFDLTEFAGLGKANVFWGVLISVILLALIGLPPTVGFTAKWLLFSAIWNEFQIGSDSLTLTYLLVAIFATAISLFYYLRVPYYMFLKDGEMSIKDSPKMKWIAALICLLLLGLFFIPLT